MKNSQPEVPTLVQDGPRAFRILEVFSRIGVQAVKGYQLINNGELETFLIGRNRYATEEAVRAFLDRCIQRSKRETAAQRARKVSAATKASLRSRAASQGGRVPRGPL
jgi:hypothetical protein